MTGTPVDQLKGARLYRAVISTSASATLATALGTATAIRVVSFGIVVTTAVTVQFLTSTGSAPITGAMPFGANGGVVAPYLPGGHFETLAGDDLKIALGSGVAVAGWLNYINIIP